MMQTKEIAILYVDDEDINLFLFKTNFESNYPVFTASSGAEALQVLKENEDKIIVVISDMRMPVMNGVEFITRAKELYNNIIYFILTGYESNKEIEEALQKKVIQQWFSKPFDMQKIDEAIKNSLPQLN
ncbi:MAG: response regulator [Ekhidna sp.]